jgi:hypothetical protein
VSCKALLTSSVVTIEWTIEWNAKKTNGGITTMMLIRVMWTGNRMQVLVPSFPVAWASKDIAGCHPSGILPYIVSHGVIAIT